MKRPSKLISLLLIFLPLVVVGFVQFSPESQVVTNASQKAAEYEESENWPLASANLQTILDWEGWRGDVLEKLGRAQYELKQYVQAAAAFEKAKSAGTLSFDNLGRLGMSYLQIGREGDAQNLWRDISQTAPNDYAIMMQIADNQRKVGDTFGAITTLLNAYHLKPTEMQINYLLGIHLAVTQPQSAIKFLSVSANSEGREGAVSRELLKEITNTEQNALLLTIRIGQILSNAGEWDLASQSFDLAVQKDDQNAFTWALLGEALQHTNGGGFEELQKALSLDPKSDMANALMALYYRRQIKLELAVQFLEKAIAANPTEATWETELGNTLAEAGDLQGALAHFTLAIQVEPDDPLTWQSLASFCFSRNVEVDPTGLNAARKALALAPKDTDLLDLMGVGLLISGDADSAERFFSQAVEIAPNNAGYHLHFGQLYIHKKDCARAAVELKQAIELSQDERISSNAKSQLAGYCPGY